MSDKKKKSDAEDVAEQGWNTRMFIRAGKPVFSFDNTDQGPQKQPEKGGKPLPPKSPTKAANPSGKPAQAPGKRPSDRAVYGQMNPDSGDFNEE